MPVSAPASAGASAVWPAWRRPLPRNVQIFVSEDAGAHVIIRRAHAGQEVPARTLDQAGSLAAGKSWQKEAARARI